MRHGHGAADALPVRSRWTARRTISPSSPTEEIVNLGVALVPEGRRLFPKLTVEENLLLGAYRPPRASAADDDPIRQGRPSPPPGCATIRAACPRRSSLPASRHRTRCEKRIIARMMCSIMMMVMPSVFRPEAGWPASHPPRAKTARPSPRRRSAAGTRGDRARQLELAQLDLRELGRPAVAPCAQPKRAGHSASRDIVVRRAVREYSSGTARFSATVMLENGSRDLEAPRKPEPRAPVRRQAVISVPSKRMARRRRQGAARCN